jgi:hypothetical protein
MAGYDYHSRSPHSSFPVLFFLVRNPLKTESEPGWLGYEIGNQEFTASDNKCRTEMLESNQCGNGFCR